MKYRDAIALVSVFFAGVIAWQDPAYRRDFFSVVGAIVTGYFALSLPRQN